MTLLPTLLALRVAAAAAALEGSADEGIVTRPTAVRFVEARHGETIVRGRPWVPAKRMATIGRGTRLVVRAEVDSRDDEGCHGKPWYAVLPFGWVCSTHVRESSEGPDDALALPVAPGRRLPFSYAIVRHDGASMYDTVEQIELGTPARPLTKGMTIVVERTLTVADAAYLQAQGGGIVAREDVGYLGQGSQFRGVELDVREVGPVAAWVRAEDVPVRQAPDNEAAEVERLALRTRVPLFESEIEADHPLWWRIGEERWVRADDLAEIHVVEPPRGVFDEGGVLDEARVKATGSDQWVDVDLGEQVLVAYRGNTPVYATMISSGRGSPTPRGNYPVWAKVASMDMANQDYEDKPYLVQGVPWVLLFQGHNALHGAYWHDRFGHRKSHGCVNLAPQDARFVFEWMGPALPRGWTGYLPLTLDRSPVVHLRDSSRAAGDTFTQERPIGPPDREAERRKSEAAAERRAEEALAAEFDPLAPGDPLADPGLDRGLDPPSDPAGTPTREPERDPP